MNRKELTISELYHYYYLNEIILKRIKERVKNFDSSLYRGALKPNELEVEENNELSKKYSKFAKIQAKIISEIEKELEEKWGE